MSVAGALCSPIVIADHDAPVRAVSFGEGRLMATCDVQRTVKVWRDGERLWSRNFRHVSDRYRAMDSVRAILFSPCGELLFAASGESVYALDSSTGEVAWSFDCPPHLVFMVTAPQTLAVSRLGYVAAAMGDGSIGLWTFAGEQTALWFENDAPRYIGFMPDGRRLAGTDGFAVSTWDVVTQERLSRLELDGRVFGFVTSPLDPVIATRTLRNVTVYSPDIELIVSRFKVDPGLPAMAFDPTRPRLVVSDQRSVSVRSYEGERLWHAKSPDGPILCCAIDANGMPVVGCGDGNVYRWSLMV